MTYTLDQLTAALADRYLLERELGAGGMATVYLAEDLKHHRQVAIKVLRPELAALLGAERFLKEIETTANLQHPHILPLFDSGQAGSFLYYVMPFVAGESLRERLTRDGELPVAEAVRIARAVASALGAAHRRGIVHRDIKPENILLADGEPVVADFGIARAISASAGDRLTSTGLAVGTPAYMSPEQASADSRIDGRTDLYSLGAVLYEMLAGEQPFRGRTAEAITARKMTEDAPALHSVRPAVPEALDLVVRKALSRTAGDRFQSAEEFIGELDQVALAENGLKHRVPIPLPRAPGLRWAPWAIAGSFGGLAVWLALRPPPPRPVIQHLSGQVEGEELILGSVSSSGLTLSPDGRWMVYRGPPDSAPQLWLRDWGKLHATVIPGTKGGTTPVFSPDGGEIAFEADGSLKVVRLDGSPPLTILTPLQSGTDLAWSEDGHIYYNIWATGIARVRPTGGAPSVLFPLDSARGETTQFSPEALPDGRGLLFVSRISPDPASYEIVLGNPSTGERRTIGRGLAVKYLAPGYLLVVGADGVLYAAPFDLQRLALTGAAVPVVDSIDNYPAVNLAASRTGRLIFVTSSSVGFVADSGVPVWVGRGGVEAPVDPGWAVALAPWGGLALSSDGNALALGLRTAIGGKVRGDVWVKRLPSGPLSRINNDDPAEERAQPFWSPDGRKVGYTSNRTGMRLGLWQISADGSSGEDSLVVVANQNLWLGAWSPDGQWLLASSIGSGDKNGVVAIRPGRDSVPLELAHSSHEEMEPVLSFDGRWLAYSSDESGRFEVYVRQFPDPAGPKWQVSLSGGLHPHWSPHGNELYYATTLERGFVGGLSDIMVAKVHTAPTFDVIGRSVMVPALKDGNRYYWDYDVHPDGNRLLMVHLPPSSRLERRRLVVIENFGEELKTRVPR